MNLSICSLLSDSMATADEEDIEVVRVWLSEVNLTTTPSENENGEEQTTEPDTLLHCRYYQSSSTCIPSCTNSILSHRHPQRLTRSSRITAYITTSIHYPNQHMYTTTPFLSNLIPPHRPSSNSHRLRLRRDRASHLPSHLGQMQTVPLLRMPTGSSNSSRQRYDMAGLRLSPPSNAHFIYSCAEQQVLRITEPVNLLWRRATLPNPLSRSPIRTKPPQNPLLQRRMATGENSLYPLS
jgi:hypothetical protein